MTDSAANADPAGKDIGHLRQEIIDSEKSRIDLFKYKLISVGALGAVGLGLESASLNGMASFTTFNMLALIPLLCLYVDLLCYHNTIRILVIARYLEKTGYEYEKFLSGLHRLMPAVGLWRFKKEHCQAHWRIPLLRWRRLPKEEMAIRSFSQIKREVSNCSLCEHTLNPRHCGNAYVFGLEDMALHLSTLLVSAGLLVLACVYRHSAELEIPLISINIVTAAGVIGLVVPFATRNAFHRRLAALDDTSKLVDRGGDEIPYQPSPPDELPRIHNTKISALVQRSYDAEDLDTLESFLSSYDTFSFRALPNGLYPAAAVTADTCYTGYGYVWVRDNVFVAYAHYLAGDYVKAQRTVSALADWFQAEKMSFEAIISREADSDDVMKRPHIRFNGANMSEVREKWAHAENDALGYFLWLFCKLKAAKAEDGKCCEHSILTDSEKEFLLRFPRFFEAIRYWRDEDSGHWEEERKIETSSIGVVVGGLLSLKKLLKQQPKKDESAIKLVEGLIEQGRRKLEINLPYECVDGSPFIDRDISKKVRPLVSWGQKLAYNLTRLKRDKLDPVNCRYRRYDASLLFLIYPMEVVPDDLADVIIQGVKGNLMGEYGIRRYVDDTFWSPNYKLNYSEKERTIDVSDNPAARKRTAVNGREAEWCLFDPVLSIIYGKKYIRTGDIEMLHMQTYHFNRALGQLTGEDDPNGEMRCPELYYLDKGQYVTNDSVPLLWTQANLWMALHYMKETHPAAPIRPPICEAAVAGSPPAPL